MDLEEYVGALIDYRDQPVDLDILLDTAEPVEDDSGQSGTVVKEKVRCGDETCKCASGDAADMHVLYLYRYYREDGAMTSEYLGKP